MVLVVHRTEKQPGLCWRLPFTNTASNIRRTTGCCVGCQTVHHVHLPSSINFQKHKVEYHSYADDTQVNLHCDNNVASLRHAVHQLENCIFDICDWMRRNAIKLNEDKTKQKFLVR